MKTGNVNVLKLVVAAALLCSGLPLPGWQKPATPPTSSAAAGSDRPFVAEYYYKVKWGHAEEFITLFKKNHLPVLIRQVELGRIVEVTAATPRYHATEDGRWYYRVTIVFKTGCQRDFRRVRPCAATLSRPGALQARGAAQVRDLGRALGRSDQTVGPEGQIELRKDNL